MSGEGKDPGQLEVVLSPRALQEIQGRLRLRFRAYLRPGEKVALKVEDEEGFVFAHLAIASRDKKFQLDLEAAVIDQDQLEAFLLATTSRHRLLAAIEFLSGMAEEYFRSQRHARFHLDWRIYELEGAQVRFRGQERKPGLEEAASELLAEVDKENPE